MIERNTEEWREEILAAYVAGIPTMEISKHFQIGSSYAGALAKRAGVRLRGAGATWRRPKRSNGSLELEQQMKAVWVCERCNGDSGVSDSRMIARTGVVRRCRYCVSCGEKWTTYEIRDPEEVLRIIEALWSAFPMTRKRKQRSEDGWSTFKSQYASELARERKQ